jgi:hypothetical protein
MKVISASPETQHTSQPKQSDNMKTKTYQTILVALAITIICLMDCLITSLYWQHQSVLHHSASFEANSWGVSSFHWNDESFAQTPFQDEAWEKVQATIFQKKLKALGIE